MTRMARGSNANDDYTQIEAVVIRKLERSVILKGHDDEEVAIGRSLLSITSEEEVDSQLAFPATLDLEIKTWVLKKEGLI